MAADTGEQLSVFANGKHSRNIIFDTVLNMIENYQEPTAKGILIMTAYPFEKGRYIIPGNSSLH